MPGYGDCVFDSFELAEVNGIRSSDVPCFDQVWSFDKGFELCDFEPAHFFHLFAGVFFLPVFLGLFVVFLFLL